MAKTIEQLKAQGAEVKNATVVGENTATRVGNLFNDIVELIEQETADGATTTEKLAPLAVTTEKIANGAVTGDKIAAGTITEDNIEDKSLSQNSLADNAVNTDIIQNGAVTTEKLADSAMSKAMTKAISDEAQARAKADEELKKANEANAKANEANAKANEANATAIANEIKRATTVEANISTEVAKKIDATNFNNQLQKKADKDEVTASLTALENKIGERTEITGDVVNNPDEEDLTQQNNKLMLKNRAYEPLNYSGKGYKILRKNMAVISIPSATITVLSAPTTNGYISVIVDGVEMHINVTSNNTIYDLCGIIASEIMSKFNKFTVTYTDTTVELTGNYEFTISDVAVSAVSTGATFGSTINEKTQRSINLLNQTDFDKENTVYIVRYDYNLNGKTVNIPKGCLLRFDGGSISNGGVIGNGTLLDDKIELFFYNTQVTGKWEVLNVYPEWFGAVGDDEHNDSVAFKNMALFVNEGNGAKIILSRKTYRVEDNIQIIGDLEICGCGKNSIIHTNGRTTINIGKGNTEYELLDTTIVDNVGYGETEIKVTDASKFNVGEYYVIQDTVDFSFETSRAYYRQGEIIRIKNINIETNTISLYNETAGKYGNDEGFLGTVPSDRDNFTGNFQTQLNVNHRTIFVKWEMHECYIHDFSVVSDTEYECYAAYALSIRCLLNSKIERIYAKTNKGTRVAMRVDMAYNTVIEQCIVSSYVTLSGDNYGLSLGDLQYVHVKDCIVGGLSHSLATGSLSGIGAIVNRFFIYENIKVEKPTETIDNNSIEIDVHAGAEKYVYKNINLPDFSCNTGGYDMLIDNCSFYNISTSFHGAGMHVRNCNVKGFIGTLLYFDNPWRDYSKEIMIIEDSEVNHIEVDTQIQVLPEFENTFRLEQLIIRNCIINDNIYTRYYTAKYLVIENNTIKSETSVYESLVFNSRLIKPNEESFITIRNNKIFCNKYGIQIGYTEVLYEGLDKFGKVVIDGNEIIAKEGFNYVGGIFIADTGDAIIKNNNIDVNGRAIFVVDNKKLLIDYNYVSENASVAVINAKNGREAETLHEIGRNNNFKNSLIDLRYANNIKMPFGYNGWLKYIEANLSANDYGYKYQLLDGTKEELTWDGKKWLTSDKKINGKRSGTESNRPTIKAQDISKGETVEVGDLGVDDFGYEYLETNGTTFKKIVFSRVLLDGLMGHYPANDTFIENPYKKGQIYYCNIYGTPGYNVYFAKNNTDKEIENMIEITVRYGFFVAPDENEYPYVYVLGGGYFDTKYVRLWTETDGASVGVARSGISDDRPSGRDIYVGFQYMDTTLGKPIFAKAISRENVTWVDLSGTTV